MIERYKVECISNIWSEEAMYYRWAYIEKKACYINNIISDKILDEIKNAPIPTPKEVNEEEKKTKHDLVAFLNVWTSKMSDEAKQYVHYNLTSSDIKDTAFVLALQKSITEIFKVASELSFHLWKKAQDHKYTFQVGRTHGKVAQEKTLGLTFLNWYVELRRAIYKLLEADKSLVGKMSGPLGINIENEEAILEELELKPDTVPTQVISRDIFINVIEALARVSICLERIALNVRLLSQSGIMELTEGFVPGQVGSSAMPHKRNPIKAERICGLSRIIRNFVPIIYENSVLWGDRDISHSSAERIVFEEAFHLIYFMILEMCNIIDYMTIYENNIEANLNVEFNHINSEGLMNYLINNGIDRKKAHSFIKDNCDLTTDIFLNNVYRNFNIEMTKGDFIKIDEERRNKLKKNIDKIFTNVGGGNV